MKMYIWHGRRDPKESLDDWGFEGPTFEFDFLHYTYGGFSLEFKSVEDKQAVEALTGWAENDPRSLYLALTDDMVFIPNWEGAPAWFGDFEFSDKETKGDF
jgi:hypothetical protein